MQFNSKEEELQYYKDGYKRNKPTHQWYYKKITIFNQLVREIKVLLLAPKYSCSVKVKVPKTKEQLRAIRVEQERIYNLANPHIRTAIRARRRAAEMHRAVNWSNKKVISAYYKQSQRLTDCLGIQFNVDHILPLRGKLVSGLHVEHNLQVITEASNNLKSNEYTI